MKLTVLLLLDKLSLLHLYSCKDIFGPQLKWVLITPPMLLTGCQLWFCRHSILLLYLHIFVVVVLVYFPIDTIE